MGSSFFKSPKTNAPSGQGLTARAIGSAAYASRGAAAGAQKDLGAASAIGKAGGPLKKLTGSSAYPPGPKKL